MDDLSAYWHKFEKSGDPMDYLRFCRSRRERMELADKSGSTDHVQS